MASASQDATTEAVAQCKQMTQMMTDAIAAREADQKSYDTVAAEYQRRKGLLSAATREYQTRCSGSCTAGGVQQFGCHPMCRNILRMNPDPIAPTPPVFPDLGTFVCQICSQSVDLAGNAGRDINIAKQAIVQQMNCTTSLEKQLGSAPAPAVVPTPALAPVIASTNSVGQNATQKEVARTNPKKIFLVVGLIVLILIIGAIIALIYVTYGGDDEPTEMFEAPLAP